MDEKKPEQRAVICVYCNIGIPYSSDESKDKIYKLMKEHDKICQCNPLVAENERLKEIIGNVDALIAKGIIFTVDDVKQALKEQDVEE